jgi:hypothetical protein
MTAQGRRAAVLDRPQRAQLGLREVTAVALAILPTRGAHDVSQLQWSEAHGAGD